MTKEEMQLVVKAVDQASATMKAIRDEIHAMGGSSAETAKNVETLGQKIGGLANQIKLGFAVRLGQDIFEQLKDGFNSLIRLIPDAISAGAAWADQVAQIQRETGMTAEQTSLLAAVMERAGVPVDNMNRLFALLGKNLSTNTKLFNELGVATVDANGKALDAFTIIENLRQRFSEYGASLTETAAAQKLLGRTGYEMLQFLQLNNEQFRLFANAAAAAGQVLNEDVVQGAERFQRAWGDLGGVLQGLQISIFAALEPTLEAFISSFSNFLKQHMADILQFVVSAANFVMGVIGGLLGVDFGAITLSKQIEDAATSSGKLAGQQQQLQHALSGARAGEDALTRSIKAQIAAIDDQIKAIDAREAKRHAASERAKLLAAIDAAQANLADITGNAPSVIGLSSAEAVLAEQKHAQDILDARKQLSDATAALTAFDQDQTDAAEKAKLEATKTSLQQQLTAHQAAHAGMRANVVGLAGVTSHSYAGMTASATSAFSKMNADALAWRDKGVAFSNDMKKAIGGVIDALLGGMKYDSTFNVYFRSGGLIGALNTIGILFGDLGTLLDSFRKGPLADLVTFLNKTAAGNFPTAAWNPFGLPVPMNHAMGGYVPPGGFGRVGEVAAETIYAHAGGGVTVYPQTGATGSGAAGGHGHAIYLDGYLVGRAIDERNAHQHRSTSLRTVRAT